MIDNPWRRLPAEPPYILDEDRAAVDEFNRRCRNDLFRIRPEILPEPFLGSPDSAVVLLNLNPGFTDDDLAWHEEPRFAAQSRANLVHQAKPYPFYLLNPSLDAPGVRWWTQRLGALIKATSLESVSRSVLCVEHFPYHSRKYRHSRLRLQSQEYGFDLVRSALRRNAIVVVMRGWRFWKDSVPELEGYAHRFELRSVQNVSISPGNCPSGFGKIVSAIESDHVAT